MIQLLRASLLLFGYSILGIGVLTLIVVAKFMLDVLPELLITQVLGLLLTVLGIWVLGKYDQIFRRKK